MREIRNCIHHGEVGFYRYSVKSGYKYRCGECVKEAVVRRRAKLKELAVEYMGGSCCRCGYNKCHQALEFHHKDPTQKDFGIAFKGHTISFDRMKAELDKCIMLCANCHREEHVRLRLEI